MIFERCAWNDDAAEKILPLVSPDIHGKFVDDIRKGHRFLWRVHDHDFSTWLVTGIDYLDNGNAELVLECIAGKRAREITAVLVERVKKLGVKSVRFESKHPEKLVRRFVNGLGFERIATVFRVDL